MVNTPVRFSSSLPNSGSSAGHKFELRVLSTCAQNPTESWRYINHLLRFVGSVWSWVSLHPVYHSFGLLRLYGPPCGTGAKRTERAERTFWRSAAHVCDINGRVVHGIKYLSRRRRLRASLCYSDRVDQPFRCPSWNVNEPVQHLMSLAPELLKTAVICACGLQYVSNST